MKNKFTRTLLVLAFLLFSLLGHSFTGTLVSEKCEQVFVRKEVKHQDNMLLSYNKDKFMIELETTSEFKNYNFKNCINYE